MSKRFGRNQKRAMRAEIELNYQALVLVQRKRGDLEDENHRLNKANSGTLARIYQLEAAVQLTREVLGEFFSTLPAVAMPLRQGLNEFNLPIPQPARDYTPYSDVYELRSDLDRFETIEATRLVVDQVTELRGHMHMHFMNAAGRMSYGFSVNSFRGFPRRKVAEIIGNSMRDYLLDNPSILNRMGVKP